MAKEDSDNLEQEFKFRTVPDEDVLGILRALMPADWKLVKWQPRTILDVYFDTDDLALLRAEATFRLRKRKKNRGWTANYKPPKVLDRGFLSRREVRTSITPEEALNYVDSPLPGLAADLAYAEVGCSGQGGALLPNLHLVSCRRCYTVRPGELLDSASNLLNVIFEEVTAIDVRDADMAPLLLGQFMDYSRPLPTGVFENAEVETDGRSDGMQEEAVVLMLDLQKQMIEQSVEVTLDTKYERGLSLLQITGAASVGETSCH